MEKLIENISRYLESRIELIKIDVQQKIAGAIVSAVQIGLLFFMGLFTLIFASLALANWLNSIIGNSFAGHLIVAGFYLLLGVIVIAARKAIQAKAETMVDNMFAGKNEGENKEVEVVVDNAPTFDEEAVLEDRPIVVDNRTTAEADLDNGMNGVNRPGSSSTT